MWTNRQLIPPTSLIKKMTDVVSYGLPSTKLELAKFLETLAPTTLDALIKDLKDLFSKLLKEPYPDLAQLFANAKAKYEKGVEDKSLLGQVFSGLMDLKFQGLLVIHEVEGFIGKLVSEISGNEAAIKDLEDCFNEAPGIEGIEAPLILDKDDNFSRLLRKMKPVKTSVVGFRGYKQGGGLRATAANSRLIGGMAELDRFKDGMELLLKHMSKKGVFLDHCRYKPPQFTKEINESHATYLARDAENEPILLCFGITYLEPDGTIKAKDENKLDELLALQIQPYYFTMLTGNFSPVLHVRSRKLELDEGNEDQQDSGYEATLDMLEFKAIDLNHLQAQKTAASFMLAAFHFLPDNLWRSPDVQGAIALLFDKLKLIP
ncbi:MAG: hypothetical protein A2508_09005 [Candidatus Lambdaproteobacteria bacterium RIFOXYD12_FULL_49_8]|nr:MAG: hypothetical protein A2508_09005 [Candidatus Lambdaproteobacteria bacterium RIFOXYD12_FULL_49_8]